jgi:hypothetical protein
LSIGWIAGLLALAVAGSAGAAPLNYEGTVALLLGEFGWQPLPGGGVTTVNGSSGIMGGHLNTLRIAGSRGGPTGNFINVVTDPEGVGNGVAGLSYIGIEFGTGTLAPISGAAASDANLTQNVLPLRGLVKVCILTSSCETFLPLVLTQPILSVNGATTGVKGVGIGGLITIGGGTNPIRMSIQAAPWTIKTRTVYDHITTAGGNQIFTPIVMKGFAHAPASATTDTVQPGGVVQLVSPSQVETNLPFGSNAKQSSGQILLIHFIPEPGLLLLLGSGVVGLALLGRKRLRV